MMLSVMSGVVVWMAVDAGAEASRVAPPADGGRVVLATGDVVDLEPFDVLDAHAQVVVQTAVGARPADLKGLRLWRGHIVGSPESSVFLATSGHGVNGFLRDGHRLEVISDAGGAAAAVWSDAGEKVESDRPLCDVRLPEGAHWPPLVRSAGDQDERGVVCRVADLAIDTDWEFTSDTFGGDADAAATYAITLAGGVSEIFQRDLNVRLEVSFVRVWDEDIDPYDPFNGTDLLDQFRQEWSGSMDHVDRSVAHLLSGRTDLPYGGVAWLSVLCNEDWGYGLSGYLNGSFPHPLEDHNPANWDLVVMAHELGHNFGTLHTHDGYQPPIDNCGNGDCDGAENGTIMSYCHTCSGGISNIRLGFHDRVQLVILDYLDSIEPSCDLTAGEGAAVDDQAATLVDEPLIIDVLANDEASDCTGDFDPLFASWDDVTDLGGSVSLVPGDGQQRDRLLYEPPAGADGADHFTYTLVTGGDASVFVDIERLREPDANAGTLPGVGVEYFELASPSQLPDFDVLTPYFHDVSPLIGYQSTEGAFATSGRSDEVGAVFEGWMEVPTSGWFTISTESDDGSRLLIDNDVVVNNDGTHGMLEVSGTIGLMAGKHAIRVEFFEAGGGAGLIVRFQGPDVQRQIVPASSWWHTDVDQGCPEDINGDGLVGVSDLLVIIAEWGACSGCDADVDGSGDVGVGDILAVLELWGSSC